MKKGRFELAEGGSIFLDEIGELPAHIQVKLLRVLQERQFERLGGGKTIKCDVRVIAATNRNLEEAIKAGDFREDLYYRLNVFPVYIPPLRDRLNDIPLLVDHFIRKVNKKNGTNIIRISSSALDMLMIYNWPGNIRELENTIERAAIMSFDKVIRPIHLPPTLQTAQSSGTQKHGYPGNNPGKNGKAVDHRLVNGNQRQRVPIGPGARNIKPQTWPTHREIPD